MAVSNSAICGCNPLDTLHPPRAAIPITSQDALRGPHITSLISLQMKSALIAGLVAGSSAASLRGPNAEFDAYLSLFRKAYFTTEEYELRRAIYEKNVAHFAEHNALFAAGEETFTKVRIC